MLPAKGSGLQTRRFAFPLFLAGSAILSAGPLFVRIADVGATQSAFWRVALAVGPLFLLARIAGRGTPSRQLPARPHQPSESKEIAYSFGLLNIGLIVKTGVNTCLMS